MNTRQLMALARLALEMPAALRRPMTREAAENWIRRRLADRTARFLDLARRAIYEQPRSPYRPLLEAAGCRFDDLEQLVASRGLEGALEQLRDAGVTISHDEFRLKRPIRRPGLEYVPGGGDFDNPLAARAGVSGASSGTAGSPNRVQMNWASVADGAAHEVVLYADHGKSTAPTALWYPVLPGAAGIHNLLLDLKSGRSPRRWFSHLDPRGRATGWVDRLAIQCVRIGGALAGLAPPRPEWTDFGRVDKVIDWLLEARGEAPVLRTYVSSAVRLVEQARRRGADIAGATFFVGGEPLTETRRRFIETAGVQVYPRYVATEAGLLAAGCRRRASTDDMHLYSDRVAVISGGADEAGPHGGSLLVTSLSPDSGVILFNTELGDHGKLTRRRCDCAFGRLGLDLHLSNVGSARRLTLEGMTVGLGEITPILETLLARAGGSPDSFQLRPTVDAHGLGRLTIAISPELRSLDEAGFLADLYAALDRGGPALAVAAGVWRQAGTLVIERSATEPTAGFKHAAVAPAGAKWSGAGV